MQYVVHGVDNDGVHEELELLAERHWSYMDQYADRQVARGPTLSTDGSTHTGSVHVLEAATLDGARRFAFQEPYWLAGLYSAVTVARFQNALGGTMWDRQAPADDPVSTLVLGSWPADPTGSEPVLTAIAAQPELVFGGLLLTDDGSSSVGLVAALDVDAVQARSLVAAAGLPGPSALHRWRRGGRQQPPGVAG